MSKAAKKKAKAAKLSAAISPTQETMGQADFVYFQGRYRRVPVIDTLLTRGQINDSEYRALAHYRDQTALAERSPLKSCLDQRAGSKSDCELSAAVVSAILTTARIERDLGSLAPIARAVAVDDKSLSQWCVDRFGGRERLDPQGKCIAIVPVREKETMRMANMELRMAAHRIVA